MVSKLWKNNNIQYHRKVPTSLKKIIGNYKVPILPLDQNPVVVDCGTGVGYFFWFYNSFFSKYIGIEASTENINFLKEKIKITKSINCEILHNACYSKDNIELELKTILGSNVRKKGFTANNNSLYYEVGQKNANWENPISENDLFSQKVKSVSLENIFKLLKLEKIDFLKIDIEGAEYDFLMNKRLDKIRFLSVELPYKKNQKNFEKNFEKNKELINHIEQEGFIKIFSNDTELTFANKKEKINEIYFVDFPTLYFSKLKNDIFLSQNEREVYLKKKQPSKRLIDKILNKIMN